MRNLRIVTLAGDPDQEALFAAKLDGRDDVDLVLRCVDRVELLAAIRGGDLDAILSVGAPVWVDPQSVDEAARRAISFVGATDDPLDAEHLNRLGAFVVSTEASIDDVVERCRMNGQPRKGRLSAQPSSPKGKLFAVWGPKGAPGRTRMAIELAAELASQEPDTLLVDADPYGGDAQQLLGVVDEIPSIVWASQMAAKEELDGARLALDLRRAGKKGPVLLPGLSRAELWSEVSEFGWRQLLIVARASFTFTVCDVGFCLEPERAPQAGLGEGRNIMARATIAAADRIVVVFRADAVGIKNFLWALEELRTLAEEDGLVIVANRVRQGEQKEVGDIIRRHLGRRPLAYVADRPGELSRSERAGLPLREVLPGSDVVSAVRSVAAAVGGRVPVRGVLTRLGGRRS